MTGSAAVSWEDTLAVSHLEAAPARLAARAFHRGVRTVIGRFAGLNLQVKVRMPQASFSHEGSIRGHQPCWCNKDCSPAFVWKTTPPQLWRSTPWEAGTMNLCRKVARDSSEESQVILGAIGNTPLVPLRRLCKESSARVMVKPEYLNPSGSIKDRIALRMIEDAERQGRLRPGMRIVEASSGNTAAALAFVGAVKGYKVTLYVPTTTSEERIRICKAYGAEVISVDVDDPEALDRQGIHGALAEFVPRQVCLQEEQKDPTSTWWARQFSNPSNVAAHEEGTAVEILEETGGKVDAFVCAIGTAGTLVGVGRALRKHSPSVKIVAVEPEGSRTIKGGKPLVPVIEGLSGGILLRVVDEGIANEVTSISEEEAISMCHRLAEEEGLFCGVSSGANVLAALRLAEQLGPGKQVVTILVDSRDRYIFVERFTT